MSNARSLCAASPQFAATRSIPAPEFSIAPGPWLVIEQGAQFVELTTADVEALIAFARAQGVAKDTLAPAPETETAGELMPCPFCGYDEPQEMTGIEPDDHWVQCSDCGSMTGCYESADLAATAWNARAQGVMR